MTCLKPKCNTRTAQFVQQLAAKQTQLVASGLAMDSSVVMVVKLVNQMQPFS